MRKVLFAAAALVLTASSSFAGAEQGQFALGFVDDRAPIGGAVVLTPKIRLDVGLGFGDTEDVGSHFTLAGGLPIAVVDGDKCTLSIRPGLAFTSVSLDNVPAGVDDSDTSVEISGMLMVEYWLSNNLSVSAGHGINIATDPSNINLFGADFTSLGFMFYLPKN